MFEAYHAVFGTVAVGRLARLTRHARTSRACELLVVICIGLAHWAEETIWPRLPALLMHHLALGTEALAES